MQEACLHVALADMKNFGQCSCSNRSCLPELLLDDSLNSDRIESECIQQIVDQISSKLRKTSLPTLRDLVGVDIHLEHVKSLLKIDINDVRIVGIWGM